jgi:hypothetical protein
MRHETFMNTLVENDMEATEMFFQLLRQRLPQVPNWQLCDHLRWYARQERHHSHAERQVGKWKSTMSSGVDPHSISKEEIQERRGESGRLRRLLRRADEEEETGGAPRPKAAEMRNMQRNIDREVLDSNLTGHQLFRKSPGYTFGASRDPRDYVEKRFTDRSHVRSSSHMDNPGPGHYCGLDEKRGVMRSMPVWSLRDRMEAAAVDKTCPVAGPGYHGKLEGSGSEQTWKRAEQDLRNIQGTKPSWTFGREAARFEAASSEMPNFEDLSTPAKIGPGRYIGRGALGAT